MFKKTVAVTVVAAITCLNGAAPAESEVEPSTQSQANQAIRIKARVQKIGVGEKRNVRVKLRDGTAARGYVSNIENDSFTVTDSATRKATSLSYRDVASVGGKGLSTAAKVLIVSGVAFVIVVVIAAVNFHPLGSGSLPAL